MIRIVPWLLRQTLLWAGVSLVLGPYFFWRGFRILQRKRRVMDTPHSTIRAATLGSVEMSGKAIGPYTVVAPLSQADCLYYRVKIQSNPRGDLRGKIQEMCAPFFLDDGTGMVMIYPQGAELLMPPSDDRSEYGKLATMDTSLSQGPPEFAQEYSVRPGQTIFVLGTLQQNPWAEKNPATECTELSRIGPGFVSLAEAELIRREALPYLDPNLPSGALVESPDNFDFHPPVILMKGAGPFIISCDSQREVISRLNLKSLLYIWGGPVVALWGLWEILSRAGWL